MDASGFIRVVSGHNGPCQAVILRRVGATDVSCPAAVMIGGATEVVGDIQQTADRVMLTDRAIRAAGWLGAPHHGDQVIYANGKTTIVQGRAEEFRMEADKVYVLRCLGG
jgi:hypothetical protein